MKNEHYFIAYEYTSDNWEPRRGNAVISEKPVRVWQRTLDRISDDSSEVEFAITGFHTIGKRDYDAGKKHNPSFEDYVALSDKDASLPDGI